ncbi:MAG TPA: choice-of-anchor Q domain-containing protein [Solirubrobacteraceae bacterium]
MRALPAGVALAAAVAAFGPAAASGQTLQAACTDGRGDAGSLASAITAANAAPGPDTVALGAGCTYLFERADNNWYGPNALPAIAGDITIEGNGGAIARDPIAPRFRLFFVGADPSSPRTDNYVSPGAGVLTLRDVTLANGYVKGGDSATGGGGAGMGGAVFNQGTLIIERSTLTRNGAQGGGSGTLSTVAYGGGGIGADSVGFYGGGFAASGFGQGGKGGAPGTVADGGGAGFRVGENGGAGDLASVGAGGGAATGLGGAGGDIGFANGGDGGGGGGRGGASPGSGGGFGDGGAYDGGGGGVGGGGGLGYPAGGGGGFGGGGGPGTDTLGHPGKGGSGGFGAGGGPGTGGGGAPGFGGGTPTDRQGGGGAGMGGAIFNMQGRLTIRASTFTRNDAVGGIDNVPDHAKGMGGAIFNLSGTVTADGSTFAVNDATYDGASIYNLVYDGHTARAAQVTLRDTIVAAGVGSPDLTSNKTAYIYPPNLGSATVDVGQFDLITSMVAREQGTISGSPLKADPRLGPLRDNGGPTATMAPATGSPAIDAGAAFGLTSDQRGAPRPSDFDAVANRGDGTDIGAYEVQAPGGASGTSSGGSRHAFGTQIRITLRLGAKRIPARGPLPVIVINGNRFTVTGRLSGATTRKPRATLPSRAFRVRAGAKKTVRLALSKRARRRLAKTGRLGVRLRAVVRDLDGHTRTVTKTGSVRRRRHR